MLGPRSRIVLVVTGLVAALAVPAAQSASAAPGAPVITALYTTDGSTAGGTEVFIDGENLTDVTQVMFGSTPATSFDALVPSELSAVTPAHDVGVVQVRIVTTHGTTAPRSGTRFRFAPENDASLTRDTVIDRSAGGFHPPTSLSCGSTGFCATVIDGRVYTRADDAWAVARTPRRTGYRSVACSATGACVAWGSGVATRESSGWSAAPALKGVRLAAAWCGDGGICRAVDTDGAVWQHAHGGWTKTRANLEKGIVALDCSSTGRCIAVDDLGGVYRHAHGTPWRKTVDALRSTVSQVTCWDGRKCAAGVRSDDHGELHGLLTLGRRHWHHAAAPRYGFAELSCRSGGCTALNRYGETSTSGSGVTSWSTPTPVVTAPDDGLYQTLSCPSAARCVIVDENGYARTLRHGRLTGIAPVAVGHGSLDGISCATTTSCVAVDYAGNALTLDDGTWSAPEPVGAGSAISCPTTSFCASVGDRFATLDEDGSWTTPRAIVAFSDELRGVRCTSASFCVAWTRAGLVTTWDGSGWSPAGRVRAHESVTAVSCWADGACAATTLAHDLYYLASGTWTRGSYPVPQPQRTTAGLDCPTSDTCYVGIGGSVVTMNRDSAPTTAADILDDGVDQIQCARESVCVVANSGYVSQQEFGQYTTSYAYGGGDGYGISCPVDGQCEIAVDDAVRTMTFATSGCTPTRTRSTAASARDRVRVRPRC